MKTSVLLLSLASAASAVQAQSPASDRWQFGAVLDLTHTTRALQGGLRDQGLQLGHSDLTASGPLGPWLRGHVGAVFATHEGQLEKGFEEVYVETTALPAGLQLRAGRFASQIGYLNPQHLHADDFSERPLLYRSFLGSHWNDDGLRLNLVMPTSFYWMVGAEAFRGKKLVEELAEDVRERKPGVATLVTKFGADLNRSHSWQMGLSYIHNRREAALEDEHEHGHDHGHDEGEEHAHAHAHGAAFTGRKTWMLDATWKWAPNGNNRDQQVRVTFEAARITGLNRYAGSNDKHEAHALSAVWRFNPSWEAGVRSDWLRVSQPHGDHFHQGRLREQSLMLAWKPSHMQTLRLQLSRQSDAVEFENPSKRSVFLQYVIALGAHGAHSY